MKKEKIKEKVLEELSHRFYLITNTWELGSAYKFEEFEEFVNQKIDELIQETAKQIFDDIEKKFEWLEHYYHVLDYDEFQEIKNKWLKK